MNRNVRILKRQGYIATFCHYLYKNLRKLKACDI